jgi:Ni,Fe-hydrogenase III large subunit
LQVQGIRQAHGSPRVMRDKTESDLEVFGRIIHWLMADGSGRLERVKILDPSFLNWRPLSYALLKNIVPDFPRCNKSFNQSYSGNDL